VSEVHHALVEGYLKTVAVKRIVGLEREVTERFRALASLSRTTCSSPASPAPRKGMTKEGWANAARVSDFNI